jgi:Skp family chaperone for outer membrane proteins
MATLNYNTTGFPIDPVAAAAAAAAIVAEREGRSAVTPLRGRKRQRSLERNPDIHFEEKGVGENRVDLEQPSGQRRKQSPGEYHPATYEQSSESQLDEKAHGDTYSEEPSKAPNSESVEIHPTPRLYTEEEIQAILKQVRDENTGLLEEEKRKAKVAQNTYDHLMQEYTRQKEEHEYEIENHVLEIEKQKNEFLEESNKLQEQHAKRHRIWVENSLPEKNKYIQEIEELKGKLNELHASHIRAVNSVGTGLEPIADKTFEERFRSIHDEVCLYPPALIFPLYSSLPG